MRRLFRALSVLGICALLALPFVLVLLRNPHITTLLPVIQKPSPSNRYSTASQVKGYTLSVVDTSYLDYMTAKFNVFAPNAVVSPGFYTGKLANTKRQQISHITFVLVDHIDTPISIVQLYSGKTATLDCQGDYVLTGDTLVDRVAVGFDALGKQVLTDKYA